MNADERGSYFSWGETTEKADYDWLKEGDYKWGVYDSDASPKYGMTRYTADVEGGDGLKTLQPDDDPATANWGTKWRTPTFDEIKELLDETMCKWTWDDEKKGYTVTGPSKKSIFLPAAGYHVNVNFYNAGTNGYYWTSSVFESNPCRAHSFGINSSDYHEKATSNRYLGLSVRAVTEY